MPEEFEGRDDENLNQPPSFFPQEDIDPLADQDRVVEIIPVSIEGIFRGEQNGSTSQFVLLASEDARLPIMIGPFEAQAILASIEQERPDRPMTHDLLKTVIDRMGGVVTRVLIDDLWHGVYYAKISIEVGSEEMVIDSRPSDAIAVAVRFNAGIYVTSNVFQAAIAD